MIKAFIFDFDGLIIDSETPDYQTWVEVYAEYGAELPLEKWVSLIGGNGRFNPYQYLEDQIGYQVNRVAIRDKRSRRFRELCEQKPILPGVIRMIQQAKDRQIALAVATNSFSRWVNYHLTRLQLHNEFDVVITLDQITIGKPEPKMYQTTLNLLGASAHEAIAFEDSPAGAMGAKRAGIYTIAIPNQMTQNLDFSHCDRIVASMGLLDIDEVIEQATNRSTETK